MKSESGLSLHQAAAPGSARRALALPQLRLAPCVQAMSVGPAQRTTECAAASAATPKASAIRGWRAAGAGRTPARPGQSGAAEAAEAASRTSASDAARVRGRTMSALHRIAVGAGAVVAPRERDGPHPAFLPTAKEQ